MNSKAIGNKENQSTRAVLADKIPLSTPYMVQIFPVYNCNFRCNYCIHSLPSSERGFISEEKNLDFELYKKCIDDLAKFPEKLKMLRFGGTGEPLLHPQISEMIEYATQKNIAESIEIVTNGALLNKKLSDKLIKAGLNWLRVSMQGVNSTKYKDISKADIDFEKFTENLKYFYENKKETKIYIKVMDVALDEGEEEKFYAIFQNICDRIAIEYLVPTVPSIDYSKISHKDFSLTQNGNEVDNNVEICPQPFYMIQINPDGNIVPCCSMETAFVAGNIKQSNLFDIWNGDKYKEFRILQLKKEKNKNNICKKCTSFKYAMFKEDILDKDADKLLKKVSKQGEV